MADAVKAPRIPVPDQFKKGDILIREDQIVKRVGELALEISGDYEGKELLLVGIMGGAPLFHSDLAKALHRIGFHSFKTDWVRVSTYGSTTESSRQPRLSQDMKRDAKGQHILIVDEVSDTGHTMKFVEDEVRGREAASVVSVVFVQKDGTRLVGDRSAYIGYVVGGKPWLQGYGMDSEDGVGREDPNIRIGPYHYAKEQVVA